ncbi:MAG TPA: cyclase family protein [Bacteroidia bacterium]|nr:cyclase family protein [Bacteroidia bacterium]
MTIIDLSHIINPDITVFPGTEKPVFERIDIESYPEIKMTMFTHTATHIDAPIHVLKGTKSLDEFPVSKFIGRCLVIDCKHLYGKHITKDFLKQYETKIKGAAFVLFNSGWSLKWKTDAYFEGFPTLTADAATWLTGFNLQGIGLDSISLDPVEDMNLPNHRIVLDKEILIIENLCNLDKLPGDEFMFQCLPLKIEHADGSPVRAIAIFTHNQ